MYHESELADYWWEHYLLTALYLLFVYLRLGHFDRVEPSLPTDNRRKIDSVGPSSTVCNTSEFFVVRDSGRQMWQHNMIKPLTNPNFRKCAGTIEFSFRRLTTKKNYMCHILLNLFVTHSVFWVACIRHPPNSLSLKKFFFSWSLFLKITTKQNTHHFIHPSLLEYITTTLVLGDEERERERERER